MAITVHKTILKELGPSISQIHDSGATNDYSYVEFEDGTLLRNVRVLGGLDGKFHGALQSHQPVELHILTVSKRSAALMAIKTPDGKLYASTHGKSLVPLLYCIVAFLVIAGLVTSGVFGLGLLLIAFAWFVFRKARLLSKAYRHVQELPNAIIV